MRAIELSGLVVMNNDYLQDIQDNYTAWYDEDIEEWVATYGDFEGHGESKTQALNNLLLDIECYDEDLY